MQLRIQTKPEKLKITWINVFDKNLACRISKYLENFALFLMFLSTPLTGVEIRLDTNIELKKCRNIRP